MHTPLLSNCNRGGLELEKPILRDSGDYQDRIEPFVEYDIVGCDMSNAVRIEGILVKLWVLVRLL